MSGNKLDWKQGLLQIVADTTTDDTSYAPMECWTIPDVPLQSYLALSIETIVDTGRKGIRAKQTGPLPGTSNTVWTLQYVGYQTTVPNPLVWVSIPVISGQVNTLLEYPLSNATYRFRLVASEPGKADRAFLEATIASPTDTTYTDQQNMMDDGILSRSEKVALITKKNAAASDVIQLSNKAKALGISADALATAYSALDSYLSGLSPAWNDLTQDTSVNPSSTFISLWDTFDKAKTALLVSIQTTIATVDCVASSNQTVSSNAFTTLDGVTITTGTKILIAGQTTTSENGIYTGLSTSAYSGGGNWVAPAYSFNGVGTYTSPALAQDTVTTDWATLTTPNTTGASTVTFSGWNGVATSGDIKIYINTQCYDDDPARSSVVVSGSQDGGVTWTVIGTFYSANNGDHTLYYYPSTFSQSNLRLKVVANSRYTHTPTDVYIATATVQIKAVYLEATAAPGAMVQISKIAEVADGENYFVKSGTTYGNKNVKITRASPTGAITLTTSSSTYQAPLVAGSNITIVGNVITSTVTGGGGGTVTSLSVVSANGVSGSVANATTTPAITLSLGAITPSSVASSGSISGTIGSFSGTLTGGGITLGQLTNAPRITYGSSSVTGFGLLTAGNGYADLYGGSAYLSSVVLTSNIALAPVSNTGGGGWYLGPSAWAGTTNATTGTNSSLGLMYQGGSGSQLFTLASTTGQASFQCDGSIFVGDSNGYNPFGANGSSNGYIIANGGISAGGNIITANNITALGNLTAVAGTFTGEVGITASDAIVRVKGGGSANGVILEQYTNKHCYLYNYDTTAIHFGVGGVEAMTLANGGALTLVGNLTAPNTVSGDNNTKSSNVAALNAVLPSGFYDSNGSTDMPTSSWYHCINNAHTGSYAGNQYQLQIAAPFWGRNSLYFRTLSPSDGVTGGWNQIYHTGNIDSSLAAQQALKALADAPAWVTSLPGLPDSLYPVGKLVSLTSTRAIYKNVSNSWVLQSSDSAIFGSVTASSISAGSIGATALAATLVMSSKIQAGFTPYGSYCSAGVQLDGTGTASAPILVGAGGMRVGKYGLLLDEVVMKTINLLDGNGAVDSTFTGWYKGNVNTAANNGTPNVGCLSIQNTFTEWSNGCVTTMWNFKINGTSTSSANGNNDNIDSLTHMEVEVWANNGTDLKRMTVTVAIPGRNYSNRTDYTHDDNAARSNMTIKYRYGNSDSNGSSTSSGNYYTKAYCRIRICNAYGFSAWRWYGMADIGVWNNGGITDPTAGVAPSGGGGSGSGAGGGQCPAPWTLLDTTEGQVEARNIKVGMLLHTEHEGTGEYGDYEVEAVEPGINNIWTLNLEDGRSVDFAANHRFKTDFGYSQLQGLYPGQKIYGSNPGIVSSVALKAVNSDVVQITVKDAHTYETSGLLSHNVKILV